MDNSKILGPDGRPVAKFFQQALVAAKAPPEFRAVDPLSYHAWVSAGASAIARVVSQAPLTVWKDKNRSGRAGSGRAAMKRLERSRVIKGAEPIDSHPMSTLLMEPNPLLNGNQLIWLTAVWLATRGECFWVLTDEDSKPVSVKQKPTRIWPVAPESAEPLVVEGEIAQWRIRPPKFIAANHWMADPHSVIQFKFVNPADIRRGLSPISAAAQAILTDQNIGSYNRRLIEGGGVPKGIIHTESVLAPDKEQEFLQMWKDKFDSAEGTSKTALLSGGWNYTPISISPKDMEYLKTLEWDRDQVLAVMGVPKGMVGVTDQINYATQLGQDRIFIEKTVMFYWRAIETAIDRSLFFSETDAVYPAFDLRGIEALRAGMDEKISMANNLAGGSLKVPPQIAFQMVGLEVPEYEVEEEEEEETKTKARRHPFIDLEESLESAFRKAYREWIDEVETETLRNFNRKVKAAGMDMADLIYDLERAKNMLRSKSRPKYTNALSKTFDLTIREIKGVVLFEIDDPRIHEYFELRERRFVDATPVTLKKNLVSALEAGIQAKESIGQLRLRVAQVFEVAASSAKSLTVARTEMSNFMNGVRNRMFEAQGIHRHSWSTAGDEVVRETHRVYGEAGPQKLGFNFLTLSGQRGGLLRHPGDVECAIAGEVINCRCTMVPEE